MKKMKKIKNEEWYVNDSQVDLECLLLLSATRAAAAAQDSRAICLT